ncbi:helix-turn-helix transcriptional regulator [Pseudonocardia alni]|uniref:DNA-binding transcriptional regulator AlpA n=1 Tax=Pseudonocardia alni TaxID=33907 RepID=A0A852WHS5_PSEA5|nr:AlpA family phage regulatory protein [Pseudonocardia antarctica]NYG04882.1 putative DNA-binding transcriptional regulator AlpA [Pseudonocardia antarctica]
MDSSPAVRYLSLSITLAIDPPIPADTDVHEIGQAVAARIGNDGVAMTTAPVRGRPIGRLGWVIPTTNRTMGSDLADFARVLEAAAREGLERVVPLTTPENRGRVRTVALEVLTLDEVDRRLAIDRFPDIVGIDEVCQILGVKRAMAYRHTSRDGFPPRVREGVAIWFRAGVERYAAELRGEPDPMIERMRSLGYSTAPVEIGTSPTAAAGREGIKTTGPS